MFETIIEEGAKMSRNTVKRPVAMFSANALFSVDLVYAFITYLIKCKILQPSAIKPFEALHASWHEGTMSKTWYKAVAKAFASVVAGKSSDVILGHAFAFTPLIAKYLFPSAKHMVQKAHKEGAVILLVSWLPDMVAIPIKQLLEADDILWVHTLYSTDRKKKGKVFFAREVKERELPSVDLFLKIAQQRHADIDLLHPDSFGLTDCEEDLYWVKRMRLQYIYNPDQKFLTYVECHSALEYMKCRSVILGHSVPYTSYMVGANKAEIIRGDLK